MRIGLLLLLVAACASSRDGYYAAAWSPDGKLIAIGTGHSLRIEDAENRALVREIETGGTVHAVCFTADGDQVLFCGRGNTFSLAPMDGEPLRHPEINPVVGLSAAMSADARTILSVSAENDFLVWRHPFDKPERRLTGGGYPWTYALTPDGRYAIGTTPDGQVLRWDVDTGRRDPLVNAHNAYIFAVAMSRDGRHFVSGGSARDKTVAVWDPRTFRIEYRIDYGTVVRALAISPDGRTLAVGGNRRSISLYDLATGTSQGQIDELEDWPSGIAFSPDGSRLLVTFPRAVAKIYGRTPAEARPSPG
ncbi:MAG: WD40 repeat domain-containing protein [Planctomycetota bacterium]|jgi:tricorn protease-like protein